MSVCTLHKGNLSDPSLDTHACQICFSTFINHVQINYLVAVLLIGTEQVMTNQYTVVRSKKFLAKNENGLKSGTWLCLWTRYVLLVSLYILLNFQGGSLLTVDPE